MNNYKILAIMAMICLLIGSAIGIFVGLQKGWSLGQQKAAEDLKISRQEAEKKALEEVNPFNKTANPFEKSPVNPFENIETNPYK